MANPEKNDARAMDTTANTDKKNARAIEYDAKSL